MLNEDYKDMLHALSEEKVRFLIVGAFLCRLFHPSYRNLLLDERAYRGYT
jgi:hypothetical protein